MKTILKIFIFLALISTSLTSLAKNVNSEVTIQLHNVGSVNTLHLPKHSFAYVMTIPREETAKGDPLEGILTCDGSPTSTVVYRLDNENLIVHLNITDPAVGRRIIWKGNVIYNKTLNTIESIPEFADNAHYLININLVQPSQGKPEFSIKMLSI